MSDWPLLTCVVFLPLLGVLFILFVRDDSPAAASNARALALWTAGATFALSLAILAAFDPSESGFQLIDRATWLEDWGVDFALGVDGVSLWFVILSTLLTVVVILSAWRADIRWVKAYMIAFLVMDSLMVGVFLAIDLVLFYVFFEAILIPMYMIIGIWGGPRRIYASFKFFLYTLLGSVLFLVAIIYMYLDAGTTDVAALMEHVFDPAAQFWLFLALFASFAVKAPMWPVHTWLPDAHVEAPTAGSVLLAGVLLKLGGYGFLRFSLPMLPDASAFFAPLIFALSVIAIVYTSLVALAQTDMKKLIAYSSIAHMGIVTIGCFTPNAYGVEGAILQMLSHGVVSAALFLCVGVLYDRVHSREIADYGGVAERAPRYALLFMLFTMASIGLPGTSGFVGEILVIVGVFQISGLVAFFAASGMVLGAAYMLWLYRRVVFGALTKAKLTKLKDLERHETLALAPLAVIAIVMGVYPSLFLDPMGPSVERLLALAAERAPLSSDQAALGTLSALWGG